MSRNRPRLSIVRLAVLTLWVAGCGGDKTAQKPVPEAAAPSADAHQPAEQKTAEPVAPKKPSLPPDFRGDRLAYKKAKVTYSVRLQTTKGEIFIDVYRELAPNAADRFRDLVNAGFYNGSAFYDVHEGYIAKAGISPNPRVTKIWLERPIADDPIVQSNDVATVSMAVDEGGRRATEFFINLRDNGVLDAQGNTPFGRVRDMQVPDQLKFLKEGETKPDRSQVLASGDGYTQREHPELDIILHAEIIHKK